MESNPITILIVEDELITELHIRTILTERGYRIQGPAISGQEALDLAARQKPDLILMDIRLKGTMDGIDTTLALQAEHDIPVIYLTANTDDTMLARAQETMPYGYLIKPVKKYELYSSVETALTRHRLERKLRESEAFSTALLTHAPTPIMVHSPDMAVTYVNPAFENLTGWQLEQIKGMTPPFPWCNPRCEHYHEAVTADHCMGQRHSHRQFTTHGGAELWVHINAANLILRGALHYYISTWIDVTERRRLEERILDVSERERIRIGQDLHDGLGQDLTGASFLIGAMAGRARRGEAIEPAEIELIQGVVDRAKTNVRLLARGLYPVTLGARGLITALEELRANAESIFGITCGLSWEETVAVADTAAATHCYYIVQESVNNAVKHGRARRVSIALRNAGEGVELSIEDDGSGIGADTGPDHGIGLEIMQYRAEIIGASLAVNSLTPSGTRVSLFMPMAASDPERKKNDGNS